MSRKKRERKVSKSAPVLLNLSSDTDVNFPGLAELNEFEGSPTIIQRVKKHWVLAVIVGIAALGVFGSTMKYLEEDAKRQSPAGSKNNSILASLNPFTPPAAPPPTTQLSKEYIYAGSRLLAVEDANANAAAPADLAVWRSGDGNWYVMGGVLGSTQTTYNWGSPGDVPAPGDYDGDGKTDFTVYRPGSSGQFFIVRSSDGSTTSFSIGVTGDVPAPADYDGDGKTDAALYRPSDGSWYVVKSSNGALMYPTLGGATGSVAAADYDGDGLADAGVFNNGTFTARLTTTGQLQTISSIGSSGNKPVSSDYDGDGKADYAVYTGTSWIIRNSISGSIATTTFGNSGDTPVQNDYDGDGKCDIATFSTTPQGLWNIKQSSNSQTRTEQWGYSGDIPVPAYFRR